MILDRILGVFFPEQTDALEIFSWASLSSLSALWKSIRLQGCNLI